MPQNLLEIPLKPNSNQFVRFSDFSIEYDGVTIPYEDTVGISFYTSSTTTSPVHHQHSKITLKSCTGKKIVIMIRDFDVFFIGTSYKSNYGQLVEQILNRIGPKLLERLVTQILTPGQLGRFILSFDSFTKNLACQKTQ